MVKVQIKEVKRFVVDCLRSAGARVQPATEQAELITYADVIGHRNYGIKKLCAYVDDIMTGVCRPNSEPIILKEKSSTAWVDPKDVMGATAGGFAMDLAIKKANETGVGWVAIKGKPERFYQSAEPYSYWTQKATDSNLIGMVFSNASSIQQPPAKKKEEEKSKQEPKPKKIVIKKVDSARNRAATSGKRDIELAFSSNKPQTSGAAVPQLAAMMGLSDNKPSDTKNGTRSWLDEPLAQNLGQCFVAVNPACFALGFDGSIAQTIPNWKVVDPLDATLLEVPLGELKHALASEFREGDMLNYELRQMNAILDLAVKLHVKPLQLIESQDLRQ